MDILRPPAPDPDPVELCEADLCLSTPELASDVSQPTPFVKSNRDLARLFGASSRTSATSSYLEERRKRPK